jgi:hypothetical protein
MTQLKIGDLVRVKEETRKGTIDRAFFGKYLDFSPLRIVGISYHPVQGKFNDSMDLIRLVHDDWGEKESIVLHRYELEAVNGD